jgi:hypothetical protein
MLLQLTGNIGAIEAPMYPGDLINTFELEPSSINNAAGVTYTSAQIVNQDLDRSGAVAVSDTLPTADQIVKALIGSINLISPPANALYGTLPTQTVQLAWPANLNPLMPGSTFRRIIRSANTGVLTIAVQANSGVSLLGTTTIAATSWREYLFKILNSSPLVVIPLSTTNANQNLTNVDPTLILNITVGMSVFGTGIGASAVVDAVQRDTGVIHVSVASTATADNVAVTFTPTVTVRGLRSETPN